MGTADDVPCPKGVDGLGVVLDDRAKFRLDALNTGDALVSQHEEVRESRDFDPVVVIRLGATPPVKFFSRGAFESASFVELVKEGGYDEYTGGEYAFERRWRGSWHGWNERSSAGNVTV